MHDYKSNISYLIDYKTGLDFSRIVSGTTYSYELSLILTNGVFSTDNITFPCLVWLDTTHFCIAYCGDSSDGYIKVFSTSVGYDTITETGVLEHETSVNTMNSLIKIDNTHVVLAYRGVDSDGFLKVFTIAEDFTISETKSLEFDTAAGSYPSVVLIDSTHLILAYAGSGTNGFIKTFSIDVDYTLTQLKSLEHDAVYGNYNSLVKIDDTHYMLAYTGTDDQDGYIKVFTIDGSYNITETSVLEHDIQYGINNNLIKLNDTYYVLAYTGGNSSLGTIKTFTVNGAYAFTQTDSEIFNNSATSAISLSIIDETHVALAYGGADGDGFIEIWSVDENGALTKSNTLEFDTSNATNISLKQIDLTHYIVAYNYDPTHGNVKTFLMT